MSQIITAVSVSVSWGRDDVLVIDWSCPFSFYWAFCANSGGTLELFALGMGFCFFISVFQALSSRSPCNGHA